MVDSIVGLISIPSAFLKILLVAMVTLILVCLAYSGLFYSAGLGVLGWLVLLVYAVAVGGVAGICIGVFAVVYGAMGNLESLIRLLIGIAKNASKDYREVSSGKTQMPSAGELIQQTFTQIFLPSLEEAVFKCFGLIGKPVFWIYKRTIASSLRYLLKKVAGESSDAEPLAEGTSDNEEPKNQAPSETAEENETKLDRRLNRADQLVGSIGKNLRLVSLVPACLAITTGLFVASIPPLLIRFFFSGDAS